MNLDIRVAGEEKLRELQTFGETLASTRRESEGSVGDTVVKVLAIIAGIFIILAALAVPNPEVAFVAVPVVLLTCALVIKHSGRVANFFANIALLRILTRPRQGHTQHHHHHYGRSGGGGHTMGGGSSSRSHRSDGGHTMGGQGSSSDTRRAAHEFRDTYSSGSSSSRGSSGGSSRGTSHSRSNPSSGNPAAGHANFGGGHGNTSTTVGADRRQHTAVGGGHSSAPTTTPAGNVGFGSRRT